MRWRLAWLKPFISPLYPVGRRAISADQGAKSSNDVVVHLDTSILTLAALILLGVYLLVPWGDKSYTGVAVYAIVGVVGGHMAAAAYATHQA